MKLFKKRSKLLQAERYRLIKGVKWTMNEEDMWQGMYDLDAALDETSNKIRQFTKRERKTRHDEVCERRKEYVAPVHANERRNAALRQSGR